MDQETADRLAIRALVANWVVWRDAGDWERFRTVWHDDGRMMATWFQGHRRRVHRRKPHRLREGRQHPALPGRPFGRPGGKPRHRADQDDHLAARQRARGAGGRGVHRALLRFPGEARRALGHRAAPADLREGPHGPGRSGGKLTLATRAAALPEGPPLAYLQTEIGFKVKPDMPGLKGAEVQALYGRGKAWLEGRRCSWSGASFAVDAPR